MHSTSTNPAPTLTAPGTSAPVPATPVPTNFVLALLVRLQMLAMAPASRRRCHPGDDRGQATTEYALVLLAAALVGLMVVAWATAGGGTARISRLFNAVIDAAIDRL
jgi:hypothetical protein